MHSGYRQRKSHIFCWMHMLVPRFRYIYGHIHGNTYEIWYCMRPGNSSVIWSVVNSSNGQSGAKPQMPTSCQLDICMMTSSNRNIFRVTGPLCGEFTGPGEFPTQRPVTRSFDVFFDLRLNKRLSKQLWGWWFETPSWSLWRHCNAETFKWHFNWNKTHFLSISTYVSNLCLQDIDNFAKYPM